MNKLLSGFGIASTLVGSIALTNPISAFADDIHVTIDGKLQSYVQPPVLINDRTFVPLRGIFEALGADVSWDNDTQTVIAAKGTTFIILQIGADFAKVNGQSIPLDVPAQLVNDHTMVPVRFISEAMGENVSWDYNTNTVLITTP